MNLKIAALLLSTTLIQPLVMGQTFVPNYEEDKAGNLPHSDVLTCTDGSRVKTKEEWIEKRRPELMRIFEQEMYGKTPDGKLDGVRYVVTAENNRALDGKALMRQVTIYFTDKDEPRCELLVYLPQKRKQAVPVFVSLNFGGNHSISKDPSISLNKGWFRDLKDKGYINHQATETSRGTSLERWPIQEIIERGYGVATAYYGDFDPDFDDGFQNGVHPLFYKDGQTKPAAGEWGSIGAWAWGLSQIADYLQTQDRVDSQKLIVMGHSRLGKAAVWAGAQDERFSIVISNNSGAGGAALSKRIFGETVERLNTNFPHWFNANYKKYNDNEAALTFDQHELIALMAPRPVYIASATQDLWADPKGEFLGGKFAEPVYNLFGKLGLGVSEPPAADTSIGDNIGYHSRSGKHDILLFDWNCYMDFADKQWGRPE